MKKGSYSHGSHVHFVMKSSKARCGARSVLGVLCLRSEFDRPEVKITKDQLAEFTGLERKAVQKALRDLREEGVIVPIRNFEGGRGNAVTYRLEVVGQGDAETPKDDRAVRVRSMRQRLMAEDSRLTFGEAQALAEKTA